MGSSGVAFVPSGEVTSLFFSTAITLFLGLSYILHQVADICRQERHDKLQLTVP